MLDAWLLVAAGLGVGVAAISRRLDELPLSEPLLGLLVGVALGPAALGVLELPAGHELDILHLVSRFTMAVALMAVALRSPATEMWARRREVGVLLVVALPGMAAVTTGLAWVGLGLSMSLCLVLGATLAPTDPVLASSVVSGEPASRTLPNRLRQILSVESGANDGLAQPLVVLSVGLAIGTAGGEVGLEALWSVLGAVAAGIALGWTAAAVLAAAERQGDIDTSHELVFSLVLAIVALGLASVVGADELLAVFVTGLAFNARTGERERRAEETIDEGVNRVLVLPLFVLFGVVLPWASWAGLGWRGPVFALTVLGLRRLPLILLLGSTVGALRRADAVWLGWFGPIGVAAVYYLTHLDAMGLVAPDVWVAGSLVVAASIVVHGLSASPGRRWYGRITGSG